MHSPLVKHHQDDDCPVLMKKRKTELLLKSKILSGNPNQSIELWKNDYLTDLNPNNRKLMSSFQIFLSHLPLNKKYSGSFLPLIDQTIVKLISHDVRESIQELIRNEYLFPIIYTLSSLKIAFSTQPDRIISVEKLSSSIHLWDWSLVFPETNRHCWKVFYENLHQINSVISKHYYLKMMILTYKLIAKYNYSQHLDLVNVLMKEVFGRIELRKEREDLIQIELITFCLFELKSRSTLSKVSKTLIRMSQQNLNNHMIVLSIEKLWESTDFQIEFINQSVNEFVNGLPFKVDCQHLLNNDLWLQCASDHPDSQNVKHQQIIQSMKWFFEIIQSEMDNCDMIQANNAFECCELFFCWLQVNIPLEHLLPFDQMRLLLLSLFLFVKCHRTSNVDQWKQKKIISSFCRLNKRLWNSIRRIWLFDFISASSYTYSLIYILSLFCSVHSIDELFNRIIRNIMIMNDITVAIKTLSEFINVIETNPMKVKAQFIQMLLINVASNMKNILFNNKKIETEQINQLIKHTINVMYSNVSVDFQSISSYSIQCICIGLQYSLLINHSKEKWLTVLKGISPNITKLVSLHPEESYQLIKLLFENRSKYEKYLPEHLLVKLWIKYFDNDNNQTDNIVMKALLRQNDDSDCDSTSRIGQLNQLSKIYSQTTLLPNNHNEEVACRISLLAYLIQSSNLDEFRFIINQLVNTIVVGKNLVSINDIIGYYQLTTIVKTNLDSDKCRILNENFNKVLMASNNKLFFINNRSTADHLDRTGIKITILDLIKSWIAKLSSVNFDHLALMFQVCFEINITKQSNSKQHFNIDCQLILHFNDLLIELVDYFNKQLESFKQFFMINLISILKILMVSIIKISSFGDDSDDTDDDHQLILQTIAHKFQQTFIKLFSNHNLMEGFQQYLTDLVCYYINHKLDGHLNLKQSVDESLKITMYHLIDFMIKHRSNSNKGLQFQLFHSKIEDRSKDLLKTLIEQYEQYHKFKGYV